MPQPMVTIILTFQAVAYLGVAWWLAPQTQGDIVQQVVLSVGLFISIVLSYAFPIHVDRATQICLNTVPLYLVAVMLQPMIAVLTAMLSVTAAEFAVRKQRKTYATDILTGGTRMVPIVLFSAMAAHAFPAPVPLLVGLIVAAGVQWIGDLITAPLVISSITGEGPLVVLSNLLHHGSLMEVAQYLIGMAGALAAACDPWLLLAFAAPLVAVYHHFKRLKELHDRTRQLLERIADTVDDHDAYTGGHSRRVALFTEAIVKEMNVDRKEAELIILAARIHDIGKIDIPASVLQKPGRLTPEERALIETHPDKGADMLLRYPGFGRGIDMIRFHHEAWDGSGYPRGLKGTAIPFGARVIAVADSFDAMTSDRPYRSGMPVPRATLELQRGRGAQWDEDCVDAFLNVLPSLEIGRTPGTPALRLVPPSPGSNTLAAAQ